MKAIITLPFTDEDTLIKAMEAIIHEIDVGTIDNCELMDGTYQIGTANIEIEHE